MVQEFIGVGYILDIEQFNLRIGLGIEVIVHILQHVLDTNLFAITNAPYAVELQPLDDSTLENEHCCGTRTRDEIHALRVKIRYGQSKHTMVIAGEQSDAVGAYECSPELLARIQYALFEQGTSLRRAFLKAPLSYSRISSRFSEARLHPIKKIVRAHHGVDYAAPSGTPVYSVGDGVVTARAWDSKGGGNYIKIKHNSTYTTEYMHLKGFASGISVGTHVSQGQLIGYVGMTGTATGPHLDYRVFKNGTAIDPLRMDLPAVDPIAPDDMPVYLKSVSGYMTMLGLALPDIIQSDSAIVDTIKILQSND